MTDFDNEKICKDCKESFPADNEFFYARSSSKDGLASYCKACYKEKYRPHQKRSYDVSHRYGVGI